MGMGLRPLTQTLVQSCAHSSPGEKHTAPSWAKREASWASVKNSVEFKMAVKFPAWHHVTGHALQYVPGALLSCHFKSPHCEQLTPAEDAATLGQCSDRGSHRAEQKSQEPSQRSDTINCTAGNLPAVAQACSSFPICEMGMWYLHLNGCLELLHS